MIRLRPDNARPARFASEPSSARRLQATSRATLGRELRPKSDCRIAVCQLAACSCAPSDLQYNRDRHSRRHGRLFTALAGRVNADYVTIGQENLPLLTESEVQRSFRNLFKTKDVPPDTFDKAEALLDELRPESPLRHRLSIELEEIRKLHTAKA